MDEISCKMKGRQYERPTRKRIRLFARDLIRRLQQRNFGVRLGLLVDLLPHVLSVVEHQPERKQRHTLQTLHSSLHKSSLLAKYGEHARNLNHFKVTTKVIRPL